jgi:predicted molibdopterin-dependent oxidoreductase YjgC
MENLEIFEPFDKLVTVRICGQERAVPENNTILRGLQYLEMEGISEGEFCWNGECLNCQVWIRNGEKEKAVMSCRTNVLDGMEIIRISREIEIGLSDPDDFT